MGVIMAFHLREGATDRWGRARAECKRAARVGGRTQRGLQSPAARARVGPRGSSRVVRPPRAVALESRWAERPSGAAAAAES
eukprot:scaffold43883_cov32-Tisochrysis_lutea.AAC.1